MRYLAILSVLVCSTSCAHKTPIRNLSSMKPQTVEQARSVAKVIADQPCKYVGYNSQGDDDGNYTSIVAHGECTCSRSPAVTSTTMILTGKWVIRSSFDTARNY